jgi:murein DD-endopeptidase MepM/ murein hydrolase activator NlpD
LDKKNYTIFFTCPKASNIKKLTISSWQLKGLSLLLILTASFLIYLGYDYTIQKKSMAEMRQGMLFSRLSSDDLRSVTQKIFFLEEQIKKLKSLEKQMDRDLDEIREMKKHTRMTPIVIVKKSGKTPEEETAVPEDSIALSDEENPRFLGRLRLELLNLQKEIWQRSTNLRSSRDAIYTHKSVLLATPSLWPVGGRISSGFGETRQLSSSGGTKPHKGVDIAAPMGTPILAPADGRVTVADSQPDYGLMICLDHGYGFMTKFGHMQKLFVKAGDKVKKGQTLGTVGMSGFSNGPHLHYELRIQGNTINPSPYLTQRFPEKARG